jgi:CspA family cold shock protein
MATGKVKWFNNAKGYGFILAEEGGEDLFAHYSSIEMDGYKTLKAGQDVEFEVQEGPKGQHAVNIRAESDASEEAADGAQADADAEAPPLQEQEDEQEEPQPASAQPSSEATF